MIEVREKLLGSADNETLIVGDMFTLDWIKEVDVSLPTICDKFKRVKAC